MVKKKNTVTVRTYHLHVYDASPFSLKRLTIRGAIPWFVCLFFFANSSVKETTNERGGQRIFQKWAIFLSLVARLSCSVVTFLTFCQFMITSLVFLTIRNLF